MTEIKASVVLMDIEGTTTSISFVKEVLFPFAKQYAESYLQEHWDDPATQTLVQDLFQLPQYNEYSCSQPNGESGNKFIDEKSQLAAFVKYLIDKDLKLGPLKTLQGYIWAKGYNNGSIKGHVYEDVPESLKRWSEMGLRLAIYSSGSIKAQELLFSQTEYGNLLPYIAAHYDTTSGHKQEMQSYKNIANDLECKCCQILFLTDIVKEAEAARAAGMQTIILSRPGNASLSEAEQQEYHIVTDFNCINLKLA